MSKKGLFASLIITCVLTLSLGIYTLVSVFGVNAPQKTEPTHEKIEMAFRTSDFIEELVDYSEDSYEFVLEEGQSNPLVYDEETGKYVAASAGEVEVVITLDKKGNKKTLLIKVYQHGVGTVEQPYVIANAKHLVEFANLINTTSAVSSKPENVKLVADIDIGGINWKPIGKQGNNEFTGVFDGNNHTIKNLSISLNETNFYDYVAISGSNENNKAFLDLGLFGKISYAKILNLNVENATINVSNSIYDLIKNETKPEGAEFEKIVRLTIGTVAGSAYNSDIVGAESKSKIVSRINAYSCSNSSQVHGLGGVVGVAQLVRVSNYDVKTNIINNQELTKDSRVGGVFGAAYSSYNAAYINEYNANDKTVIDNVEVDFSATLLYSNASYVGGMIGLGQNVGILNSAVSSFKIVDNTARQFVDYSLDNVTLAAGVASVLRSVPLSGDVADNKDVVKAFVSGIENVKVNKVDVFMLGGDVAGVVGLAGRTFDAQKGLTETMVIKDALVSGNIIANKVGGFSYQVNPGTTVTYSKSYNVPVIDIDLQANMSAGIAVLNYGKLIGFEETVQIPSEIEGEEPTTEIIRTKIDITTTGMGALIEDPSVESIYRTRESSYAIGIAGITETKEALLTNELGKAEIKNFDVKFVASNSVNYGGIAFKTKTVDLNNIYVNADFTSYNYSKFGSNISTTYMVSGAVCEASAGTTLKNINVVVNANKNITDKTLKYGASFFGGLVARYTGDSESLGLAISSSTVSGDVYFNDTYESVKFGETSYKVFIAGGLIGAIEEKLGSETYVDAFAVTTIKNTYNAITSNTVNNLKITADFTTEIMGSQGYRVKGIGALVGVVNVYHDDPTFDLSSNSVVGVEIVADEQTFTYAYEGIGGASVQNITLGANKQNVYGSSYYWNSYGSGKITNPEESEITYSALSE